MGIYRFTRYISAWDKTDSDRQSEMENSAIKNSTPSSPFSRHFKRRGGVDDLEKSC